MKFVKFKTLTTVILILCTNVSLSSAQVSTCQNLYEATCGQNKTRKDVTGKYFSNEVTQERLNRHLTNTQADIKSQFSRMSRSEKFDELYRLTYEAFRLGQSHPECRLENKTPTSECKALVAESYSKQVISEMAGALAPEKVGKRSSLNAEAQARLLANGDFKKSMARARDKVLQETLPGGYREKVESIAKRTKAAIAKVLNRLPLDEKQKTYMIKKINSVEFSGFNCSPFLSGSVKEESSVIASLATNSAMYDPWGNTFTFCYGYSASSTSEFSIASIVSHEISHSLDPCSIFKLSNEYSYKSNQINELENEYPLSGLVQCLRQSSSAQARRSTKTVQTSSGNNAFCDDSEQINESFADWLSAEVVAEVVDKDQTFSAAQFSEGVKNSVADLCTDSATENPADPHPSAQTRMNKIMMVNPDIRSRMGCEGKVENTQYCSGMSNQATTQTAAEAKPSSSDNSKNQNSQRPAPNAR